MDYLLRGKYMYGILPYIYYDTGVLFLLALSGCAAVSQTVSEGKAFFDMQHCGIPCLFALAGGYLQADDFADAV